MASPIKDHSKKPPSMGPGSKAASESLPRKVKDGFSSASDNNDKAEEGIQVAIRMRPMNTKETETKQIWKVLPRFASVTQTTPDGQPLSERITGRTFFTYDKAFPETASTRDVYNAMAKGIVESAITGVNGTVFAYGQTSSGKTFTMQGCGTIEEGLNGNGGGIVHMAAADIFHHIATKQDRVFLVRASFLEIYNEEVRDLLSSDNKTLPIREDPRRGVFVQCEEEIVGDFQELLGVLFRGDKSRSFASTAMNERSSRSHTILRITIESRQKSSDDGETSALSADNESGGAVLVSTLNLVDLAGSESVRHTGATGERQKEGGMINQSLLTLSRVIVALGSSNQMHINFRDSKLTRILQPSLSGNSRISFICCATPTEMCLEETRSTLQFAARAKLVKTNARVNEVLDDRSIIKKLQRELEEARRQANGVGVQPEHLKALEKEAASAGSAAREAEEKLKRLQASILNSGSLLGEAQQDDQKSTVRKRRLSEGNIGLASIETPKKCFSGGTEMNTVPRMNKKARTHFISQVESDAELGLYKQALQVKSSSLQIEKSNLLEALRSLESREAALSDALTKLDLITLERDELNAQFSVANDQIKGFQQSISKKDTLLQENNERIESLSKQLELELNDRRALEEVVDVLQTEKLKIEKDHQSAMHERHSIVEKLEQDKRILQGDIEKLSSTCEEKSELIQSLRDKSAVLLSSLSKMEEDTSNKTLELMKTKALLVRAGKERDELRKELIKTEERSSEMANNVTTLSSSLEQMKNLLQHATAELSEHSIRNTSLETHINNLEQTVEELREKLIESSNEISSKSRELVQEKDANSFLSTEVNSLRDELDILREENNVWNVNSVKLQQDVEKANKTINHLQTQLDEAGPLKSRLDNARADIQRLEAEKIEIENQLALREEENESMTVVISQVSKENQSLQSQVEDLVKQGQDALDESNRQTSCLSDELTRVSAILERTEEENAALVEQRSELECRLDHSLQVIADLEHAREHLTTESNNEIDKLQSCISVLETNISALNDENEKLRKQVTGYEKEKEHLKSLRTECDEYEKQISNLRSVIAGHVATCQNSAKMISGLQLELSETKQRVQTEAKVAKDAKQEASELSKRLEASNSLVANLVNQLQTRDEEYSCTQEKLSISETNLEDRRRMIEKLEAEILKQANEIESVRIANKTYIDESESKIEGLMAQVSTLDNEKKDKEEELAVTQKSLQLYTEEASKMSIKVSQLNDTINQKDILIRDLSAQIITSGDQAKREMQQMCDEITSLQRELDELKDFKTSSLTHTARLEDAIKVKEDELINLHEMLETSINRENASKQKLNDLEDELTTKETILSQSLERHQLDRKELAEEIEKRESAIEDLSAKLACLQKEKEAISAHLNELENQSTPDNSSLILEINELKMLLASSNTSVDEAREKARQALAELSRKDEEIISLTERATELEYLLKRADSRDQINDDPSEALEETLRQKEELERAIEQMEEKNSKFEADMKALMMEEKHKIVREAEERMRELKLELDKTRELLRQSEEDALARQRSDELHDKIRASSSSSENLLSQVGQLQSENKALKDSLLRHEKARNNDKTLLIELERRLLDMETEKNTLMKNLEQAEFARQSETLNSKELGIKVSEMEILLRNATSKAQLARDLELRISAAEQEMLAKENKIRSLSEEIVRLQQDKGPGATSDVIEKLHEQLREKDERIKKLKKSTLTKEQVAAMKKLKEKSKVDQERLKDATQKIADLEKAIQSTSSGDAESTELTRLRFHIDAVEKKLRKYASHCQHLEEERARLTHVLRGAKLPGVDPEDLSRSIVNICDKVASLEEQYKTSERSGHDAKLVDQFKLQIASLESRLKESLSEVSCSRAVEQRLKVEISTLQQEQETLRKSLSEARHSSDSLLSDSARKLRFLEKENLQLMSDLKVMRKDLQNANAKISMLEIQQMNTTTIASSNIPHLASHKLPPHPQAPRADFCATIDKENEANRTSVKQRSPGIRETENQAKPLNSLLESTGNEENTQECAQS